jgi:hypothetical protein
MAALGLMLMLTGTSLGVEIGQTLPIDSEDFGVHPSGHCHGLPTQDQIDWHFVLKQSASDDQTLTVTFGDAGTVTVGPDETVDTGGAFTLHYDVYTTGDDTLLAASTSSDTGTLVLRDICGPHAVPVC